MMKRLKLFRKLKKAIFVYLTGGRKDIGELSAQSPKDSIGATHSHSLLTLLTSVKQYSSICCRATRPQSS